MKQLSMPLLLLTLFALLATNLTAKDIAAVDEISKADPAALIARMTPLKGTTPAQWRVIWTGDAARAATISWSTAEPGKNHRVHYSTKPVVVGDDAISIQAAQRNGAYSIKDRKKEGNAYFHHTEITGLEPDTRYYFILDSDGEQSRQFYFRTAPASGTDFTLVHGGDSRSGHTARSRMNLRIAEQGTDERVLAFAHGGDYIVSGQKWDQWRLWLSQHELTTCEDGRILPIIPTRGNHDGGPLYFEIFDLDPDTEHWHVTNLGKDVALVTLATNAPAGGAQAEWLEEQLKRLRPESRWLLVQYHRPMYPAVKSPARHAPIFCPLFDTYNVDIALESDGHCMKRTVPIRDGKKDPTGVTYVGEGGLGVGQRKTKSAWYLEDGGKAGSAHHIMRLDLSPEKMRVRFILMDGSTWDDHTLAVRD